MRLVRFGPPGGEQPGILDSAGHIRDLSGVIPDICGEYLNDAVLDRLRRLDLESLPIAPENARLGPCVGASAKFVCVGLNYVDHAEEAGRPIPTEPVLFMKATSAICGPEDDMLMPLDSKKSDWEVELGVVIGTTARRVPQAAALEYVAGYCLIDDLSERSYQSERGGQWVKGKSLDTYGPIGPWLVTRDELPDPHGLSIWQNVDETRYQDGSTSQMIFKVDELVSYISQFMTLLPGDLIATGTPAGVGLGQKPDPVYLRPGQTLHLGADGLGEQTHKVVVEKI